MAAVEGVDEGVDGVVDGSRLQPVKTRSENIVAALESWWCNCCCARPNSIFKV